MVCTSSQHRPGIADIDCREIDGVLDQPLSDRTLHEAGVRLDLGQLDGLVLPLRGNSKGGDGHSQDQRQGQQENEDLSHNFLTFLCAAPPRRMVLYWLGDFLALGDNPVCAITDTVESNKSDFTTSEPTKIKCEDIGTQ